MKKQRLLALILSIILILLPLSSATVEAAELPDVDATAYVVMDATDGEILLQKNSKKRIYPASTAKLLTAVTALDNAGTGRKIKTTQKVLDTIPSDSSQLFLPAGCTYKMGTYLNMLLISSSADAAVTLASGTCGSATKFIKKMNSSDVDMVIFTGDNIANSQNQQFIETNINSITQNDSVVSSFVLLKHSSFLTY